MVITRRLPSYRYEPGAYVGQVFSRLVTQYHFNAVKNILEELPDKLDTDQQIQSYKNIALDAVLDKFLPNVPERDVVVDRYNEQLDDLDVLLDAAGYAEDIRLKYKLDDDLSFTEVLNAVSDLSAKTLAKIKDLSKASKEDNKGGDSNVETS